MDGQQKAGNSLFTARTTMLEALTANPSLGMERMRDFHLGGSGNCGLEPIESIENVTAESGIPTKRLLTALNRQA
jgi:hypothetical protein